MKIIRASHLGMCFGVRDAINLALSESRSTPLTILGDLVHNETVLSALREQGVAVCHRADDVTTPNVMITAHGASARARANLQSRGLNVVEATCPLVHFAHRAVAQLVREGYSPVIIGKPGHVEVRGLAEDLTVCHIVLSEEDIDRLPEQPRFGVVAQTTQPIAKVRQLVSRIEARFPRSEVRFVDTVCQPTKLRQLAALELALQCDVVVVIGGAHSNNTHELVSTCRRHCANVYHVQDARDLQTDWFAAAETVGVTAGTSTPDDSISEVIQWLEGLARFRPRSAELVCSGAP